MQAWMYLQIVYLLDSYLLATTELNGNVILFKLDLNGISKISEIGSMAKYYHNKENLTTGLLCNVIVRKLENQLAPIILLFNNIGGFSVFQYNCNN